MNVKKTLAALCLASLAVFTLTGCGSEETGKQKVKAAKSKWIWLPLIRQILPLAKP